MKKILLLLLCFNIVLAPTYALANASYGGWTITQQIAQGASLALSASKTAIINGASVLKTSTAKITPNASQVAKVLRGGAAGYALSIAVEQILGSAVDWVLDPANNQITYKPKEDLSKPPAYCQNNFESSLSNPYITAYGCTIPEVAQNLCKKRLTYSNVDGCTVSNFTATTFKIVTSCKVWDGSCYGMDSTITPRVTVNPYYNPTATNQPKTLPLDTIAARVISNAETSTNNDHKVGAQVAITTAAQDLLANDSATKSDVETQLNTNAKTQTSEQAIAESTPKDPAAPEAGTNIKITFPVFCSWAPIVCEAAQSAIKFPTTVENWWNTATQAISTSWVTFKDWLDWTKNDSELPDTETNQVTDLPIPELQENAISWSASCPPDVQVPINLYGQSSTLTFSWSPWCQLLNIIKPAIIASAYIGAAFIVLGLRT